MFRHIRMARRETVTKHFPSHRINQQFGRNEQVKGRRLLQPFYAGFILEAGAPRRQADMPGLIGPFL